jgi:hypothetical protein
MTMKHLRRNLGRSFRRRLCAGCTLFAYLVTALNLPLPAAAVRKDASQPFPCQNHPCGCQTAEECWRHCCCFSAEERWAWARAHNVEPPSYAEKPATTSWRSKRKRDQGKPCCSDRSGQRCCQTVPADKPPRESSPKQGSGKTRNATPWVLGLMALACKGSSTLWVTTGSVVPPSLPLTWTPSLALTDRISCFDEIAFHLPLVPLDPPPRSSIV